MDPEVTASVNVPPPDHQEVDSNLQNSGDLGRGGFRGRGRGRGFPRGGGFGRFNNFRGRGRGGFMRGRGGPRMGNERDHPDGDPNEYQQNTRFEDKWLDKLSSMAGPAADLPPVETGDKKFSAKNRLYVGNLPDVSEEELQELFSKLGECGEIFLNKEKSFAFIKFDYLTTCEKVKRELDGYLLKGKNLKIRSAPILAAIKVRNLTEWVSNELLYYAFQIFGDVEKAVVLVDEKGRPTGDGVVEFSRKGAALNAIRRCNERSFFLTESLRPVVVEPYEYVNDQDGYPEKYIPKRNPDFLKSRSKGPRVAEMNSFEHEYGLRWKQLLELYAQKEDALKKELQLEKEKLEAQMEYAKYEHDTEMLREELRAREMDRERQKQEWEMKERNADEQRRRAEEQIRRQEENLQTRMHNNEEEMRRRQQENNLFMQAHQLHNMLDEQEQSFQKPEVDGNGDGIKQEGGGWRPGGGGGFRRGHDRRDDFAPKRRRF